MMNNYISLCMIALVATIQTMPTLDDYNTNINNISGDYDENKNFLINNEVKKDQHIPSKTSRHLKHIIDGTVHHIKAAGVTYRQRLHDDQCTVEYDGQYLTENSVIQIRKKLYRVEDCLLERVFHACGPNLLLMINVVCRVVEPYQTTTTPMTTIRRPTIPSSLAFIHRIYPRASKSKTPRVITESCCEGLCTISELSRYCPR
jgi:hypothetical protein